MSSYSGSSQILSWFLILDFEESWKPVGACISLYMFLYTVSRIPFLVVQISILVDFCQIISIWQKKFVKSGFKFNSVSLDTISSLKEFHWLIHLIGDEFTLRVFLHDCFCILNKWTLVQLSLNSKNFLVLYLHIHELSYITVSSHSIFFYKVVLEV